jgi:hypothetical protein
MKRSCLRLLTALLTLGLATSFSVAGGQNRAGTSAAAELLIPLGARYLSMAGSAVGTATGPEATFWNPAGIDLSTQSVDAIFAYRVYFAEMSVQYLTASAKFDFGSIALSFRSLSVGDIPVTTETQPDGTGEIITPTNFVVGLSYSRQLSDRTSVGATVNLINEGFGRVNATGVAFDLGVQYRGLLGLSGLAVGVVVKNIGPPMQYTGSGLFVEGSVASADREQTFYKVEPGSFEMPSVVEIGLGYDVNVTDEHRISVASTYQSNNFAYDEWRIGLEYGFNRMFFVRGGYLLGAGSDTETPSIFQNFTVGAGIAAANLGGVSISIDYAFIPVKFFDANHAIAIRLGF